MTSESVSVQSALQFIPHRPPMVFIDSIVEFGTDYAIAELTIRPELMFCEQQGLPSWTAIEIMAQTVSAFAGHQGQQRGATPQVGYLLGTRKLVLEMDYFEIGKTLKIKAQQHYMHEGLGQFQCEIQYDTHCLSALLSVYQPHTAEHKE
ncbi:MAG: 3-hydroxylacyl-ACP dehydratase [Acinetobacter sp.]